MAGDEGVLDAYPVSEGAEQVGDDGTADAGAHDKAAGNERPNGHHPAERDSSVFLDYAAKLDGLPVPCGHSREELLPYCLLLTTRKVCTI